MTDASLRFLSARLARGAARIGLVAYLAGSVAMLWFGEIHFFQRFGSLGVASAILFFTDRLMQIELRRQRTVERILHEYGVELEVMKGGLSPKDIPSEGYVIDYLTEERSFDLLRGRASRMTTANVLLLSAATLQWGFGDAFLQWLLG